MKQLSLCALLLAVNALAARAGTSVASPTAAAKAADWKTVEALVDKGASPDSIGGVPSRSLLMDAAVQGNVPALTYLMSKGADVNLTRNGYSALSLAALEGPAASVSFLLEHGADAAPDSLSARRALEWAVSKGRLENLRLLLQAGARLESFPKENDSLLDLAARGGSDEAFKLVYDALVKQPLPRARLNRLLFAAAGSASTDTVRFLLAQGADKTWRDEYSRPVSFAAAGSGSLAVLQLVYDDAVGAGTRGKYGYSFLSSGAGALSPDVIRWGLSHGAPAGAEGDYGGGPLETAAAANNVESLKLIAAAGVPLDRFANYSRGQTALSDAASAGAKDVVKYLLDEKGDSFRRLGLLETAYDNAAMRGNLEVLKILKRAGADGTTPDAAARAAQSGNAEVMRFVLANGGDVRQVPWGQSVLELAAESGSAETVAAVLDAGGDTARGTDSALVGAARAASDETVRLLIARGVYRGSKTKDLTDALNAAASVGSLTVFRDLLDQLGGESALEGLDPDQLLSRAAGTADGLPLVRFLLERGANPKAVLAGGWTPLMSAANAGSLDVLELLLKRGANPKAVARDGDNAGADAVWLAAPRGSRFLRPLLAAGGSARAANRAGLTTLHRAGSADDAKALLEAGADLKAVTSDGETPIAFAASRGDAELVKLLIARGVDPSRGNKKGVYRAGWSPLHAAVASNVGLETVEALLQGGAAPDPVEDYQGTTPLMTALEGGRVDVAKALIAKGADLRVKNKAGTSAAQYAAEFAGTEPLEMVADALGADFDANVMNDNGYTPLHAARSVPVARLLLERGAKISETKISLICGGQYLRPLPVFKLLIDRGADAGGGPSAGCPLSEAARSGRDDLMQLLLDHGANSESGEPLASAAAGGWVSSMQVLLDHGAQVNGQPGRKSPLAQAASNGHLPAVKFLLKKGADVDAAGRSGASPFAAAAQSRHWDVVRFLLDAGVKRDVLAQDGVGALVAAAGSGDIDDARLLVRKGVSARRGANSRFDESPLSAAASHGDVEMISFLLQSGARNEDSSAYGCSALCEALQYAPAASAAPAAEALLKGGAILDSLNGRGTDARTDLMSIAQNTNEDKRENTRRALNWLLDHGAKADAVDAQGRTALFHAAAYGAFDNIDLLLSRGARAGLIDSNGDNALAVLAESYRNSPADEDAAIAIAKRLMSAGAYAFTADKNGALPATKAAANKHAALLDVLLDANPSSVSWRDGQSRTLLHTFDISGSTAVLRSILAHKPDVNARDNNNLTPLMELVGWTNTFTREGHAEALGLLLAAGADLNAVNNDGCTALGRLSQYGVSGEADLADELGLAKILLDAGADPNRGGAESGKRCVPLASALQLKKWELAKLLLEHNADPNAPAGWNGEPLLGTTASSSQVESLKFLLDRKVSPDLRDGSGRTPLMEAAAHDAIDAARLLVERGADGTLRDKDGNSALMLASSAGASSTAAYLRNRFPDTDKPAAAYVARAAAPAPAAPAAAPSLSASEIQNIVRNAVQGAFSERQPAAAAAPAAPVKKALVSDVDKPAYSSEPRLDDVAIVVGIENYSGDLPSAEFAERDADAVAAHLAALGVPARNLIRLTGSRAGRASIEKYVEQWLPRVVKEDSRVYFYFSGHGAPDPKNGASYIVPWDGDPNFLETTAYPISRLYKKLGALKAASVLVAMDSCFSGAKGRSVLPRGARPLVTKLADTGEMAANLTSLTASDGTQITGTIPEQGHGLFTYYLLKGLNGAAASDGNVSLGALYGYLKPRVSDEAARQNRDQTPQALPASLGDRATLRLR